MTRYFRRLAADKVAAAVEAVMGQAAVMGEATVTARVVVLGRAGMVEGAPTPTTSSAVTIV